MSESEQTEQDNIEVIIGGNVEQSLKGDANIVPYNLIKDSFKAGRLSRLPIGLAVMVLLVFIITIGTILSQWLDINIVMSVLQILITPLLAGLALMGIKSALGGKLLVKHVFDGIKDSAGLIQASIVMMFVSIVIALLLAKIAIVQLLVLVIFQLLVSFALPLIVEKRLTSLAAIRLSILVSWRYLHKIIICNLVTGLLFVIGLMPVMSEGTIEQLSPLAIMASALFILFIVLPFHFTINGMLYRELFGVKVLMSNKNNSGILGA